VAEWGHDLRQALEALPPAFGGRRFSLVAMTLMVVGLSLLGEGLNEFVNPLAARQWNQKSP